MELLENIRQRLLKKYKSEFLADEACVIVIDHQKAIQRGSVFGNWTKDQAKSLAIHLESLSIGYGEIDEDGRSAVFDRAALSLYEAIEHHNLDVLSLEGCKCLHGIGNKIRMEMIHYWQCAIEGTKFTPREEELIEKGSAFIADKKSTPKW